MLNLPNACSRISDIFELTSASCKDGAALFLLEHFVSEVDVDMMDIQDFRCHSSAVLPFFKGCSDVGGGDLTSWHKKRMGGFVIAQAKVHHFKAACDTCIFPCTPIHLQVCVDSGIRRNSRICSVTQFVDELIHRLSFILLFHFVFLCRSIQ